MGGNKGTAEKHLPPNNKVKRERLSKTEEEKKSRGVCYMREGKGERGRKIE